MSDLGWDLARLASVNHHGFAFLLAYGVTWLAAAVAWHRLGQRVGAYAVLFQGLVALPIALGLMALTSSGARPDNALLDQLATALALSQAFALPLVIHFVVAGSFRTATVVFAVGTLVHFAPYSWLYQTPLYLVLAGVLGIGLAVLCRIGDRGPGRGDHGAWTLPAYVGGVLVTSSLVALAW